MGVLTKPDRIEAGCEEAALKLLLNETKPLKHGYVMVKNRTQEELDSDLSLAEARTSEKLWFSSSKFNNPKARVGVGALTVALTELLVAHIRTAIPSMKGEIVKKLGENRKELKDFGQAPPDTHSSRSGVAAAFIRGLGDFMRCVTNDQAKDFGLGDDVRVLYLERTARKLFVKEVNATKSGFGGENDKFDVEVTETGKGYERDEGVEHCPVGTVLKKRSWKDSQSITNIGEGIDNTYRESGFTASKIIKLTSYFRGDLAENIEAHRGRELPGFLNFSLFTRLMGEYVSLWADPIEKFRATVSKSLLTACVKFIESDARTKNFPILSDRLIEEAKAFVEEQDAFAIENLRLLMYNELLPSTENHYLMDTINKIRNERYTKKIKDLSSPTDHEGFITKDAVIALLKSDLGNDSNESQEVDDTIDILSAYWKLAAKRYIDSAVSIYPFALHSHACNLTPCSSLASYPRSQSMVVASTYTHPECVELIEKKLTTEIVYNDDADILVRMFRQDFSIQRRREELEATINRLETAKKRMDKGFD
jgi:hypothetical protein